MFEGCVCVCECMFVCACLCACLCVRVVCVLGDVCVCDHTSVQILSNFQSNLLG